MKTDLKLAIVVATLFVMTTLSVSPSAGDFPQLLKQVPSSANFLVIVKSNEIRANASDAANREIKNFVDSARLWPAVRNFKPDNIVIAAEMNIEHMAPQWEMVAIDFRQTPNLEAISSMHGGSKDKLAGKDVLWLEDSCVLAMASKQLTFVSPLNRQSATRWIKRCQQQSRSELSPYLEQVAGAAASGEAEITLAIDFENIFSRDDIAAIVNNSDLLQKLDSNPTDLFASVRGLTIKCRVDNQQDSELVLDFGQSTESLSSIVQPLMIAALVKAGAMLDEFYAWDVKASGNQIAMSGKLSPTGISRILSMTTIGNSASAAPEVVQQEPAQQPAQPNSTRSSSGTDYDLARKISSTKSYFRRVNSTVDDIQRKFDRDKKLEDSALWLNNYSRRLETLSSRNIDPEMVRYGQFVSDSLKDLVSRYHSADEELDSAMASAPGFLAETEVTRVPTRRYNIGGYRTYEYAPMVSNRWNPDAGRQRRGIRDAHTKAANDYAESVFKEIEKARRITEEEMKKKYGDKF